MCVLNAEDPPAGRAQLHPFLTLPFQGSVGTDKLNTAHQTRNPEKPLLEVMWEITEESSHS